MNKLYNELAPEWYQLFTPLHGYEEEADSYHRIIGEHIEPAPETMLELGSGAGHVAYYFRQWYRMTLTDLSSRMLAISRQVNPDCGHYPGDMRTLRLNQTFDAVFIHDAIMYMVCEQDLKQVFETARVHCRAGGFVLVSPDCIAETFEASTDHGGEDADGRGLRYLSWTHDPDPADSTYTVDYACLMRHADGRMEVAHDRHTEGVFPRDTWLRLLEEAGFAPLAIPDAFGRVNFLGRKP